MIKTTLQHFILDNAINVMFDAFTNNFKTASKDFLSSIQIGDVRYMEVRFNDYIIKGSMKVADTVTVNEFDINHKRAHVSFIHLIPLGTLKIFDHGDYDSADEEIPIEYHMTWIESVDDTGYEYKGEFSGTMAVTPDDIIAVG